MNIRKRIIRRFWILYNRIKFKIAGVVFEKNMSIFNQLYLKAGYKSSIKIGENFAFSSGGGLNPLARNIKGSIELEEKARLIIGNNVGISSSCLWVYDFLKIGARTKIGADCIIMDSDAHSLNYLERRDRNTDRPNAKKNGIVIGEDVLIGARCIILKGVIIGSRSIIGSGSVVTKNIPGDCIAAGNPAKVIRTLKKDV